MRVAESENIIIDGCPHHRSALLESGHGRRHALTILLTVILYIVHSRM